MLMLKSTFSNLALEAGCDEAGRGCLCGPVFAATVILPPDFHNEVLNDSKKLSQKEREYLQPLIEKEAICWAVSQVKEQVIDEINILNASILAMHQALDMLPVKPDFVIVDGNRFKPYRDIPFQCIVKGDAEFASIAAASVLAKVYRDAFMNDLHKEFPAYGWNRNKGYATLFHKKAISEFGITHYHRKSFNLNEQLKLNFEKPA
jgi:ribonuclease HII